MLIFTPLERGSFQLRGRGSSWETGRWAPGEWGGLADLISLRKPERFLEVCLVRQEEAPSEQQPFPRARSQPSLPSAVRRRDGETSLVPAWGQLSGVKPRPGASNSPGPPGAKLELRPATLESSRCTGGVVFPAQNAGREKETPFFGARPEPVMLPRMKEVLGRNHWSTNLASKIAFCSGVPNNLNSVLSWTV